MDKLMKIILLIILGLFVIQNIAFWNGKSNLTNAIKTSQDSILVVQQRIVNDRVDIEGLK